jgi:hypothetical protein
MIAASELAESRRDHIARYARGALHAADAMGRIPTPLEDVNAALKLTTPQDLYDLGDVPPELARRLRRLVGKVKGAFAFRERVVYLDAEQPRPQRRFVHGHELGHHALPWHQDAYYGDDHRTLDPDTHEELEAEANAFSAELLFNIDAFTERAHATMLGLAPALELADTFDTSRHAAIRRYVESAPRPCGLLIIGKYPVYPNGRPALKVLRSLESNSFRDRYGTVATCIPTTLPINESELGRDAYTALSGQAATPVILGHLTAIDSRRGAVRLDYEVYSNTYRVFVLLKPHRRLEIGTPARTVWSPTRPA